MDIAIIVLRSAALFFGIILARSLLSLAWRILRCPKNEWEENRRRYRRWSDGLTGRVAPLYRGDDRVHLGLAVDKRTNTWVPTGKLSGLAVESIVGRRIKLHR